MDIQFVFGKITTIRLPNKDSPSVFSQQSNLPIKAGTDGIPNELHRLPVMKR